MCLRFRAMKVTLTNMQRVAVSQVGNFLLLLLCSYITYIYIYLVIYLFFLLCLLPVWSPDWQPHTHTELPAEEGNHCCHSHHSHHFYAGKFLRLACFSLTPPSLSPSLCREIFMGARPRTVWRFARSNSSAGCMHIFCKYMLERLF